MWSAFTSNQDCKNDLNEDLMDHFTAETVFQKVQSTLECRDSYESSTVASEEEIDELSTASDGTWIQTEAKLNRKSREILDAKSWAEEGPSVLQFLGGLISSSLAMTVIVMCFLESPSTADIGLMVSTVWLCILLCFMEWHSNEHSAKMQRRLIALRVKPLKFLWGRGFLCMITGTLQMMHMWKIALISGGVMLGFGFISFLVGWWKFYTFRNLPKSLDGLLWSEYTRCAMDSEGLIKASEFSNLLVEIGFSVDDYLTIREFNRIDKNKDQKISFYEFKNWFVKKYKYGEAA